MPTDISIASNALLLIGDEPISSFTEPGAGATAAANLYPETYRMVLSEHPWTFATKDQKLSKLSQVPDDLTNFSVAYQLPPDLIRLWAIFPHSNYAIVNDILLSNDSTGLLARYVFEVDETQLPPHFTKALEYKLAADFSISVTEDEGKHQLYESKYRTLIAMARSIDSQQKPPVPIIDSPFVDARRGGFSFHGF